MPIPSLSNIAAGTVVLSFAGIATRYIYRLVRNAETSQDFVYDMATNHLPHIYDALKLLCHKESINLPDPPPIQFVTMKKDKE
jgi:hypothetical protein